VKYLIFILFLFASCASNEEAVIKNLTKLTKKDDCKIITKYVGDDSITTSEKCNINSEYYIGDYVKTDGEICCEKCIVSDEIAEQVLKNSQFTTNCVGGAIPYFLFVVFPTIVSAILMVYIVYK
jgi:hypothetical protein